MCTRHTGPTLHHVDQYRLVIVDEQQAFAEALGGLLSTAPDLQVVAVCSDLTSAVEQVRRHRPEVITVDVNGAGADVVARLHAAHPEAAVVVVTGCESGCRALQAIWSGATAWASKNDGAEMLFNVVRIAARGESWFPPRVLGEVLRELAGRADTRPLQPGPLATLTPREFDVLQCLVEGLDRKASARRLLLSVNTVRTHVQSLFAKLGVHNTLEAVAVALDAGLRSPAVEDPLQAS
jgi:DNA-binding NarL/FixJ family response regulator